ncbi:MAG: hypothetical protein ABI594_15810 [Ginsengibacter sp.]
MANILVIGSLEFAEQKEKDFIDLLGQEIIAQGHKLLNGCRSELDAKIAESAFKFSKEKGKDPNNYILSYVDIDHGPIHSYGTILKSRCVNWTSLASPGLEIPESIMEADIVIVVGGKEGTNCAANWARISGKSLLPVTTFGGAANEIYYQEFDKFDAKYSNNISKSDYEILNQISPDAGKIAKDAISLAGRTITSNQVFIIMSFSEDSGLIDAFDSFQEIAKEFSYIAEKIDNANAVDRIVKEILERIKKAAFVIVDLTETKPNVYYELGIAQGLGKPVIITAKKGTTLPFDVADIPTILWQGQKELKEKLRERISLIAPGHGRA